MKKIQTTLLAMFAVCALMSTPLLPAQSHIVSNAELRQAVEAKSHQREQNLQQVNRFLSGPHGEEVLQTAKLSMEQVTSAVANLNDEVLETLAAKTQLAERQFAEGDFAGGRSTASWILLAILLAFNALIAWFLWSITH